MSDGGERDLFRFVEDWQALQPAAAEAIRAFWLGEGALADEAGMEQRLPQVVMHALDPEGRVAGVCTAVAIVPPRLGQPVYYWRTFVGAAWRSSSLVMRLLKRSAALLEEHARSNGYPCIGILLELENARFSVRGRAAAWYNPPFVYIGQSPRGLDLRVMYFKGARLKARAPAAGAG
ncbi:MAG: hypothetical protein J0H15_05960 [Xanthomonadales bacterium]|nr:hypothetical protein [Xanthomonadales bacterium]